MRRTMGEWRRADSGCAGALILHFADLVPGPGWGLRDSEGRPKSAWYALRQVCAPLAVHIVDEGMPGLDIRMWNDAPDDVAATVEVTLYAAGQTPVGSASREVTLPAHGEVAREVEDLVGAFRDVGWNYRFGPPSADVVHAVLRTADGREVSDVFLPAGPARDTEPEIGLTASIVDLGEDECLVEVSTRRFAQYVAFDANGWIASDAWFHLAPGQRRTVRFLRGSARGSFRGEARALNSVARSALR
jgi:beta-mannosidase